MIPPVEAWARLLPHLAPLAPTGVARREAVGLVLAAPLAARVDVPAADVAAMDGYAVAAPVAAGDRLAIAGVVAAGAPPGAVLPPGNALRIMTGAPMPEGADRVVPFEDTGAGAGEVVLARVGAAGSHVRRRGEVVREGEVALPAGTVLSSAALSVAATHGAARLTVHRRPRLAILTTGDEVVPPEAVPLPGQLRDSHTDLLLAAGAAAGAEVAALGIAPDRQADLARSVNSGLAADVLVICGGVSAGEFDFVEGVLAGAGCRILFDAVAIQPGKPVVAAVHAGGLVFGLPGNPASVAVTFHLFVRPALRRLLGHADGPFHGARRGTLTAAAPGAGSRDRFVPAAVTADGPDLEVRPLVARGSHDLHAFAQADALLHLPAGSPPAGPGDPCIVLPLP